jgi:hypothetical protein
MCHSIGKPVHSQRTWSNAWSSYNNNKILRKFIHQTKTKFSDKFASKKINYKLIKKLYIKKSIKMIKQDKKKSVWY